MQITLIQDEILEALETYVRSQISVSANQNINIELRSGRGDNGYTATLDIRGKSLGKVICRPRSMDEEPSLPVSPETKEVDQEASPEAPATSFADGIGKAMARTARPRRVGAPRQEQKDETDIPETSEESIPEAEAPEAVTETIHEAVEETHVAEPVAEPAPRKATSIFQFANKSPA